MLYFVIPAYNEEGNIGGLIEKVASVAGKSKFQFRIIIIDDGSTDGTDNIINKASSKYDIILLKNDSNMGLGPTMAKGLKHAVEIGSQNDIIVTLDGDATHDPLYVPLMLTELEKGFDVIIASRFAPGGHERGLAFYRKLLSRGSGTLLKLFFPIKDVQDYTSGYRMFRAETVKLAFEKFGDDFIQEQGFSVTPEILLKLHSIGAKINEVGFTLKYDEKIGLSKIKVSKTIVQYLKMIARFKYSGF